MDSETAHFVEIEGYTIQYKLNFTKGDIIPPDATIIFDAEVVEIVEGKLKWYKIDGHDCSEEESVGQHDSVSILYSGFTESKFDFTGGEDPYTFKVGDASVLKGLNEGVLGMCIGERRRLRVPPELVVGDVNGAGIPANVRLTLDVELIDTHKEDLFKNIDTNKDRYVSMKEVEEWIAYNPEFTELIKDNTAEFDKLKDFYFTSKNMDKDEWVSRNEFYGTVSVVAHEEL